MSCCPVLRVFRDIPTALCNFAAPLTEFLSRWKVCKLKLFSLAPCAAPVSAHEYSMTLELMNM